MKAQLHDIAPNDHVNWASFAAHPSADPWDDYGWFSLTIGPHDDPGTNYFQVLVATPAAAGRARGKDRFFRGILVETFEPAVIEQTLRTYVESLRACHWQELVDQLRKVMCWEYEGM